ncbi:Eco57I restriction-modification methylase domain-containing protein [uncultured Dialister sp.]|uniref:Eco57I restriction-modification methylase domain-containing protein n=1 Tax=uncultured Dialister sp. TaxID=278064 RepID=UPI0025862AE5|nr:Eco57I restriction-modification methylase domain-containing protein [uncultured Dialister sp.]
MQLRAVDIRETELAKDSKSLLQILLKDRTTKRNIVWASPSYKHLGKYFAENQSIQLKSIIGRYGSMIQPRVEKKKYDQVLRTRRRAEVFTPSWLVDKQVQIVESELGNLSLEEYIRTCWMELACGEAPYIVTRYDSITGKVIPLDQRVGFLDRKVQRISQEVDTEEEFIQWSKLAYQAAYGYELQGDSLLLARENLLFTFYEYYENKFGHEPDIKTGRQIADIISYNIVQMNGLTKRTPYSADSDAAQLDLFDTVNDETDHGDKFTLIKNWLTKEYVIIDEISKGETEMKFDVVIGNPPYQEETEGQSSSSNPIYNYFMDESFRLADQVCLVTPARFLFNAGQTPKKWNKERLSDPHFKIPYYEQDSSKVFVNTDIKGGVAIIYRDRNKILGPIDIFITIPELAKLYKTVFKSSNFGESLSKIIYPRTSYKLTKKLHEDYPKVHEYLSCGHDFDLSSNIFERLDFIFFDKKPKDGFEYIRILGRYNNQRMFKWVRKDYIIDHPNLEKYKVFLPKSNGSGAIGEVLSTPLVGEPLVGGTETFMSFGAFDTKFEAEACLTYIKTKFARAVLGILKITQDNPVGVWKFVPLQNFTNKSDIDWTQSIPDIDRQLYAKYKLSQEEIDFIEAKVKAMD